MRIVIFSDVHGNVVALEAVLADVRRHAAPDALFVAGDLALVGPRPAEALALLRSLEDAAFVMGNCDHYIVQRERGPEVQFALDRLSAADLAFMAELPFGQRLEVDAGRELLVVHANPQNLEDPIKPDADEALVLPLLEGVSAELVAFGHYHVPFERRIGRWRLVDVASVGLPRDGDQRAVYCVLTYEQGAWQIEHRRVPFDIEAVARDYHDVGFPNAEQAAASLLRAKYDW
jgi:predicted phosphodiesterase